MKRIRTTRIALLVPLLLLASSGALIPVVAGYGGWPTVSGSGAFTALVQDIDPDSPLRCAFTFKVRAFKDAIQGSLEVSLANDAVTLTIQATTFTALSIASTEATITGTGVLFVSGESLPVEVAMEITDNGAEEYVGISFGPRGAYPTYVPGESDYAGRITIKC